MLGSQFVFTFGSGVREVHRDAEPGGLRRDLKFWAQFPMSQWRDLTKSAKRACDLMIRDRTAGESCFAELLAVSPRDGMLHYQRAVALERLGDHHEAFRGFKEAEALFQQSQWRARAAAGAARVQQAHSSRTVPDDQASLFVPSSIELEAAHRTFVERESRSADFDTAVRLLDQALTSHAALTPAVAAAALLQSWNFAYYQEGRTFDARHFARIEEALVTCRTALIAFRGRNISTYDPRDDTNIVNIFSVLENIVGRVGAAKVLHLWAPEFFPLWDTPIAAAYGLAFTSGSMAPNYLRFMAIARAQAAQITSPAGVGALKAIDEYNYCRFTKHWLDA